MPCFKAKDIILQLKARNQHFIPSFYKWQPLFIAVSNFWKWFSILNIQYVFAAQFVQNLYLCTTEKGNNFFKYWTNWYSLIFYDQLSVPSFSWLIQIQCFSMLLLKENLFWSHIIKQFVVCNYCMKGAFNSNTYSNLCHYPNRSGIIHTNLWKRIWTFLFPLQLSICNILHLGNHLNY